MAVRVMFVLSACSAVLFVTGPAQSADILPANAAHVHHDASRMQPEVRPIASSASRVKKPGHASLHAGAYGLQRMGDLKPFQNESDSITVGDLVVENRLDRVELYGSFTITRDQAGLELAQALKLLIDATVDSLQATPLPARIRLRPTDTVASPFASD
jgi:hypothetical protein